jgi:adenine-specific DNA-methyltransferase
MPTLDWIGKKAVINHHNEVPFHLLKEAPDLSVGEPGSGNLLVEGDNLLALKALLPYFAGQVKCIYIDPPYNTGNEGWIYNDNVNSPEIRKWLGKVVGGEMEDLSRHDKWLCMMYPRLCLLKDFLRQDGLILVSIDDFEAYRLRCILDEIFGPTNFIAQIVWDKIRKNDAKLFSVGHEYILVYARSLQTLREKKTIWREQKPGAREIISKWQELKNQLGEGNQEMIQEALRQWYRTLPKSHPSKKLSRYKWVDEWGPWRDRDISWPGGGGPRYDVVHPATGKPCKVPERGWGFATSEEMQRQIRAGLVVFREDHKQPPFRKAHLLPRAEELSEENESPDETEDEGETEDVAGLQVMPSVIYKQAQVSVKLQRKIFDGRKVFPNPKDHEVILRLLKYVTGPDDLILDAFAGSGTTGHAVLQLNAEDVSHRRFILVEMDESISRAVCAERLNRVIRGIGGMTPLAGGYRFCRLGAPCFDERGQINPEVSYMDLARHVFFAETGEPLPKQAKVDNSLIGKYKNTAIYLLYNGILKDKQPGGGNVLTKAVLGKLPQHNGPKVIYGTACRLSAGRLKRQNIVFKQIPYEIRVR